MENKPYMASLFLSEAKDLEKNQSELITRNLNKCQARFPDLPWTPVVKQLIKFSCLYRSFYKTN